VALVVRRTLAVILKAVKRRAAAVAAVAAVLIQR